MTDVKDIVAQIDQLEPVPPIAGRIMALAQDPDGSMSEIAELARQDLETSLVYLADIICMMMGVCTGADGLFYRFYGDVLNRLNLTEKDLQAIIAETGENQRKIDYLLNLI